MAEPTIVQIVNKATGIVWAVPEGSPTHKRCAAQPSAYEFLKSGQDEAKPPVSVSPPGKPPAVAVPKKPEKSG